MFDLLSAKPVLIGLHLAFAIIGIDAFLWLFGEFFADIASIKRRAWAAAIGCIGFIMTWIVGGYYYVKFYGPLVKPTILKGMAPWAHTIAMEAKEHIFLFVVPLALTAFFASLLNQETLQKLGLKRPILWLVGTVAGLGLFIGALGFIISAAARWGILQN